MSVENLTDHVTRGVERLLTPFKGKANFEALLASYLKEVQALEDAIYSLIPIDALPILNTAWLDVLGRIVGQPRGGRDNETYRLWIQAKMLVNISGGLPEEMLTIAALVTSATVGSLLLVEGEDAQAYMELTEALPGIDGDAAADLLMLAKPAGVAWYFLWHVEDTTFQFSTTDTVESSADRGFGDDTLGSVGGRFANAR
jgi:hypothetical protein